MLAKWTRAAALSLVSCGVLLLGGCGSDGNPTVVEPGVVTPRVSPTEPKTPNNDNPASPTPQNLPNECGPTRGAEPDGAAPVPSPVRDDEAELDADSQTGKGRFVDVEEVRLSRAGFVAVCRQDDNRLLGLLSIASSTQEQRVRVNLNERLTTNTELVAVLYADNRDGHFDWATDPRVSGDDDDPTDLEVDHFTYRVR
jgi:hypothetical protein